MVFKKMNKKGIEFKSAFFALVIVSMVVIGIGIWVEDWNEEYTSGLVYDLQDYEDLQGLSAEAGSQRTSLSVKSTSTGEDFEGTSIRGVFGLLNNIYAPFRIVFGEGGMIDSLTDRFGIPDFIRQGIVTLMVMAITFSLVAIIFRRPTRTT